MHKLISKAQLSQIKIIFSKILFFSFSKLKKKIQNRKKFLNKKKLYLLRKVEFFFNFDLKDSKFFNLYIFIKQKHKKNRT